MALIQWWLGLVVVLLALIVAGLAWWWRRERAIDDAVLVANTRRLRVLSGHARLVRGERRRRTAELVCLGAAVLGIAVMASRWVAVSDDSEAMRNRDIVLCMDVSGSMAPVVEDVIDSYLLLVEQLDGERIGFVMFDGNAVTGFPLTDDYGEIERLLLAARAETAAGPVAGTAAVRSGSSLVGDGLASCVHHFDRPEEQRSRTLVLATDNLVSGDVIYTLEQATDLALDAGAMVFGVVPHGNPADATLELRTQAGRVRGDVLLIDPADHTVPAVIARRIKAQEKKAILATSQGHSFDRVTPGALLLVLGLAGSLACVRSRR